MGNRVYIWRWRSSTAINSSSSAANPAHAFLEEVCCYSKNIVALHLQAMGNHVLVGDLMRSAALLRYSPGTGPTEAGSRLEEVASDLGTAWLTATEMLTEDLFLCTDDKHNVFALARGGGSLSDSGCHAGGSPSSSSRRGLNGAAAAVDLRSQLERVGQLHMGEFVNRLHRAALVQHPVDEMLGGDQLNYIPASQVVWASVDGSIGLIASLRGRGSLHVYRSSRMRCCK